MVFSTPIFLFYFLTLTLLVYYLVPRQLRKAVKRVHEKPPLWFCTGRL